MRPLILALALAVFAAPAWAADLVLVGPAGKTVELSAADIAAMPHIPAQVSHDGKVEAFAGVDLETLLAKVDAPSGKAVGGKALADYVLVSATDGYHVALSIAEVSATFRKGPVILADRHADGSPLGKAEGPLRLVVGGDPKPARSARMVTRIEVRVAP